jgi:hypothetical protein
MQMDETDKKLVNGLIWIGVILLLAYFFPGYGYSTKSQEASEAHTRLLESSKKFERNHPAMLPVNFGDPTTAESKVPDGYYIHDLKKLYTEANGDYEKELVVKEDYARFEFPKWAEVPEKNMREPGLYFAYMWELKKNQISARRIEAKVDLDDPDIGFNNERFTGNLKSININRAEEFLRELAIAERVIDLCVEAKLRQQDFEKTANVQAEAFMRIISVEPQFSVASGPSKLTPNPAYNSEEKNPQSPRFNKYQVKTYKPFIQEYPVQITLQCDINTFMRFLHSVRRQGQFLVIRNLQIVGPSLRDSKTDTTEIERFMGDSQKEANRRAPVRDEHVFVTISASGMDFFDPVEKPRGLYDQNQRAVTPTNTRRKRSIGGGTTTTGANRAD